MIDRIIDCVIGLSWSNKERNFVFGTFKDDREKIHEQSRKRGGGHSSDFSDILDSTKTLYCIVGGLAVNAYVEPVVSLDLDVVIKIKDIDKVSKEVIEKGLKVERFEHSVDLTSSKSDLRIQIQTDPRYQEFLSRALSKEVLGYKMNVASLENVLQGKVWAYSDETHRMSKRQKDLADIMRLFEEYPSLTQLIPSDIFEKIQ